MASPVHVPSSDSEEETILKTPGPVVIDGDEQVAFMEIFSGRRVAPECERRGLQAGPSVDLRTGYDLRNAGDRARAIALVKKLKPMVLMTSVPCTAYSRLNQMWNLKKMSNRKLIKNERGGSSL